MARRSHTALICAFFLFSGLTGLLYQVLWTRRLTLTFGHTVWGVSTVLTAFMAGLALGSFLAGRWSDREDRRYLATYGKLEGFIGLWALATLPLLDLVEAQYIAASAGGSTELGLRLFCFLGASLVLLPPTAAMGATLPVLTKLLVSEKGGLGVTLSRLYGLNTLGALLGAGLTGFFLLPTLGLSWSMALGAVLNLSIGVAAFQLDRGPLSSSRSDEANPFESAGLIYPLTFALAGASSMAYQIAWTRSLALSIGSSTYAFSLILIVFLGGLALGSLVYPYFFGKTETQPSHLAYAYLTIGGLGGVLIPILGVLPSLFLRIFPWADNSFTKVLLLDFLLVSLLLVPPTLVMGLTFPLVTSLYNRSLGRLGRSVGEVYSANTVGCIVGSFATGFFLIPSFGAQMSLKLATATYLACGLWLGLKVIGSRLPVTLLALLGLIFIAWIKPWNQAAMTAGVSIHAVYHSQEDPLVAERNLWVPPAFFRDGISSTVSVHFSEPFFRTVAVRVNGKADASTGPGDRLTQYLLGYLPALLHGEPKKVAVIGFGAGFTVEAVKSIPSVERIDCAELEPAIIEAGKYWNSLNGGVLEDPRVHIHISDGRTFIMGSPRRYDLIISEPSNPWIAGIGNLFTQDFYQHARSQLEPGGVMCQWFNLYNVSVKDLKMVLATFYDVFPEGEVWQSSGGDLVLLGSERDLTFDFDKAYQVWERSPAIQRHLYEIGVVRPEVLAGHYLFDAHQARSLAGQSPLNTDDRPLLEFSAPFSLYATNRTLELLALLWPSSQAAPPEYEMTDDRKIWAAIGKSNITDRRRGLTLLGEPASPDGWFARALLELRHPAVPPQQAREKAFEALHKTLESEPEHPLANALMGLIQLDEGRHQKAGEHLLVALTDPPPGSGYALNLELGRSFYTLGDYREATLPLARAAKLEPHLSAPLALGGHCALVLGWPERALSILEDALKRNPYDPLAKFGEADALKLLGRAEEAEAAYQEFLRMVPADANGWTRLGILQFQQGKLGEAESSLLKALYYDPESTEAAQALLKL